MKPGLAGSTVSDITQANPEFNFKALRVGKTLIIPPRDG